MTEINPIHTPCKKCVFAKYDSKTQTGCELDYLSIYKNQNTEILEAYDDDSEFFIINKKKCIGYRENSWFDQFDAIDSLQDKINKYNELNTLNFILIINLRNLEFNDLINIFNQIKELKIKPQKLILIRYADPSLVFAYSNLSELFEKYNFNIQWRIQTMLDDDESEQQMLRTTITSNNGYRFIFYINKLNNDLDGMIDTVNYRVHKELESINVMSNNDKSLICFSRVVYLYSLNQYNIDILSNDELYEFYNSR